MRRVWRSRWVADCVPPTLSDTVCAHVTQCGMSVARGDRWCEQFQLPPGEWRRNTTLEATQGQILSQSPTDATSSR